MSKFVSRGLGRKRSKIISDTKSQEFFMLQAEPSEAAITDYVTKSFRPPTGGVYRLTDKEYLCIRYVLSLVHCTNHQNSAQVFIDTIGVLLNNDLDKYRLAVDRLEKQVIKLNHTNDKVVVGPLAGHPERETVLGPGHTDNYDHEFKMRPAAIKGGHSVRVV